LEIKDSMSAAGRFVRDLLGGSRAKRYAVEVDANHADSFDIPGVKICESWQNGDGSVLFVLESQDDLCAIAEGIEGVRHISQM